ncbi:MAG: RagB/SusD family nutrient uptake outer membrane protein [Rikenellaceae bacterium]|nr:RagB/SusD family nutrient uptake outer membrane protein [Rikenellaceae bacterium]
MKNIKNFLKASVLAAVAVLSIGCNTDPEYYSTVAPEIFFTSQETVWQRYMRPFTHWKWHIGTDTHRKDIQTITTDEITIPTKGSDWYDGGAYQNMHHHIFPVTEGVYHSNFYGVGMGVALAYDAINDLEQYVDWEKVGMTDADKELMVAQLNIVIANLMKDGLDFFGGMPLYERGETEIKARATDVETFEWIEKLILDNINKIPVKQQLGGEETTYIYRAFAAAQLAQLYFNAEPYTNGAKSMYAECAKICEDIINGVYGPYALGENWNDVFKYGNEYCPEIIYGIPSDATYSGANTSYWQRWFHYNTKQYFGGAPYGDWNGFAIQPSYSPTGELYTTKLGRPMSKFHDTDLRKQPYKYEGNGEYTGLFLMGYQVNPSSRNDGTWVSTGAREYQGLGRATIENGEIVIHEDEPKIIYLNDAVARFGLGNMGDNDPAHQALRVYDWTPEGTPIGRKNVGTDENPKYEYFVIDRKDLGHLRSTIADGEESTGVRLMKLNPPVDKLEYDNLRMRYPAMTPVVRLAEIYYMLAECKMRMGDKETAAELINTVRARNFPGRVDPNPVTAANLDKYRMLDEWLVEFLGESRRRTDLIRWDAYVTESWWDHEPSNDRTKHRFPISANSMASNNLLEQNPGY